MVRTVKGSLDTGFHQLGLRDLVIWSVAAGRRKVLWGVYKGSKSVARYEEGVPREAMDVGTEGGLDGEDSRLGQDRVGRSFIAG